jgi:hypothetical protein
MKQPTVEPILSRHPLVWEAACEITGVGVSSRANQRLSVTAEGDLIFSHGPAPGAPEWTHLAPAPHAAGAVLARWEPGVYEFIFHFDRNWDPMVATCTVPEPLDPELWAAVRPHLLPLGRQPSPFWESRIYCRGLLSRETGETEERWGQERSDARGGDDTARSRLIRVFAYEDHLLLSICSSGAGEKVSLYGAQSVSLPYAEMADVSVTAGRRRWVL